MVKKSRLDEDNKGRDVNDNDPIIPMKFKYDVKYTSIDIYCNALTKAAVANTDTNGVGQ